MSGSAALSAARKRRASGAPLANNGAPVAGSPYYSKGSIMVAPTFQPENVQQPYPMQNGLPPQQMNIYENIELIKQQLAERTKLIQMQGSSIQPDKLRVLQKQNEIQTQILRQKMAIAKHMEMAGEQHQQQTPEMYERRGPVSIQSLTEPEFIYEKGVPRKNPKYKTAVEQHTIAHSGASATLAKNRQLTPFVSMILDTGVVPPPIVVLKSHDAKLEEHNHILHNIVRQLDDIQSNKNVERKEGRHAPNDATATNDANDATNDNKDSDGEEDEELLMDVVMNDLTNSREFVEGIVNKIVNETNLSEVIMKIEPLVKENQELRSLIHSQQQMMNEMNTMLLRLLNNNNNKLKEEDNDLDEDGLYQPEMSGILSSYQYEEGLEDKTDTNDSVNADADADVAPEAEVEVEAEVATEAEAEAESVVESVVEAATATATADGNDNNEDSMPHFPDQISLIVTDIQDDS